MANPSKEEPWVVEFSAAAVDQWVPCMAYSDKKIAEAHCEIIAKYDPKVKFRVRHMNEIPSEANHA